MLLLIHTSCTGPTELMVFGLKRAQSVFIAAAVTLVCPVTAVSTQEFKIRRRFSWPPDPPPAQDAVQAHLPFWLHGLQRLYTNIVREKQGFCLPIARFAWMLHVAFLWHKKWDCETPNRLLITTSQVATLIPPEMSFSSQLLHQVGCPIKEGSSA